MQPRSQGLSSLPPLVVGRQRRKTLGTRLTKVNGISRDVTNRLRARRASHTRSQGLTSLGRWTNGQRPQGREGGGAEKKDHGNEVKSENI